MLVPKGSILSNTVQLVTKLLTSEKTVCSYTLEEVSVHDNYHDCWIILFDKVYNVTEFIHSHPGGETVLLEHAGRDATFTFLSTGHGEAMMAILSRYLVGTLPPHEQIFHETD